MALSYKSALNSFIAKFKALTSVEAIEAKASASDPCFDELQQTANSECQRLTTAIEHVKSSKEDIDKQMQTLLPILREIEPQMKRIDELQKVVRLLRIFQRVKNVNDKLSDNFSKKLTKSSEIQANILNSVDLVHSMNQMCTDFIRFSSNDNAFKCYLKSVCDHWTETTKKHVEPLFDSVLKQIGWPLSTNYSMMPSQFPADALQSFKSYFKALLKLQSPSEFKDDSIEKVVRITLPMQLMITHFQKRFIFHFMTNSRTNQLDKPEWYLTQVLTWIKDHEEFVVRHVDPILSNFAVDHNVNFTSAKLQITCGLIKLIETKLETDLKNLLYDDKLFSHTFDETLLFIREIEPIFNYNKSLLNANCQLLNTFGQEQYFAKLIKLEKKKSMEFVENILNSNSAWSPIINLDDEDELKVPECADNFVLMLQSVIERFSYFPDDSHRQEFMNLLLELLDDFRLRLSQLKNVSDNEEVVRWPFSKRYFSILNTLNYLVIVLDEWKVLKIFLEISEYLEGNLFDESILCFKHMLREMFTRITTSLMNQIKVKMHNYSSIKWFCFSNEDEDVDIALCDMLHFISSAFELLRRNLANSLFEEISVTITREINKMFLEDVIAKNTFNNEGAKRVANDVNKSFLSMLRIFIDNPESHCVELLEACKLLSLEKGTSILLQEALKFDNDKAVEETLNELSIKVLPVEMAACVLRNKII